MQRMSDRMTEWESSPLAAEEPFPDHLADYFSDIDPKMLLPSYCPKREAHIDTRDSTYIFV